MGYIEGMDYPTFAQNDLVQDAVMRNLEIIAEAAKNVPEDVRKNTIYLGRALSV